MSCVAALTAGAFCAGISVSAEASTLEVNPSGSLTDAAGIAKSEISGVYRTIQEAVDAAGNMDTIIILPGTYREPVDTYGKVLYIEGTDRDACILCWSAYDYDAPPLEMARGSLKNMTVHAMADGEEGTYGKSYAMHVDFDEAADCALYCENVTFINDYHQTVGIGLRPGSVVDFYQCELRAAGGQSALYVHDWEATPEDVEGDQLLMLRSCTLVNNSDTQPTILLQSQEILPGAAQVLFSDNAVANVSEKGPEISMMLYPGRKTLGGGYLGGADWTLSVFSSGNSIPAMNHPLAAQYLAQADAAGSQAEGAQTADAQDPGSPQAQKTIQPEAQPGHGILVNGGLQLQEH